MLDIHLLREDPDRVRQALESRGEATPLEDILALDKERRQLLQEKESLQAQHNRASKHIGQLLAQGQRQEAQALQEELRKLTARMEELVQGLASRDEKLQDLLLRLPNFPDPSVPLGKDEHDSPIVRSWGTPRGFPFKPLPH